VQGIRIDVHEAQLLGSVQTVMEPIPRPKKVWTKILLLASFSMAIPAWAHADPQRPIETVYIIPGAHWDLGFLRPPDQEMDAIKPHLDAVVEACEHDADFRWTIESVWQLNAWLERTKDPKVVERMAALLQKGQIELSAADGSMHTEFLGSEELDRLVYAARKAGARFGIQPHVAMMNDTPGFSSRVPQVLAGSGVPYMIAGSNTGLGGGISLSPGHVPFYWQGPDGSKVLLWQTQGKDGGYTEGMTSYFFAPSVEDPYLHTRFYPKEWQGLSNIEITRRGITKLISEYQAAGYQHSSVAVLFMHDGIGPEYETKDLLPNVRAWNEAGMKPRLVVATPSEFFTAILKEDSPSAFPMYSGDWNSLWVRVKTNSPAMSAAALLLQDRLPEAETLSSLLRMSGRQTGPEADFSAAYRDLFIYDEHNGAGEGTWPKVMTRDQVLQQDEEYAAHLQDATTTVHRQINADLLNLASKRKDEHGLKQEILVFNPSSWTASRLTCLEGINESSALRDETSREVIPSQKLQNGKLCFEAKDVPAVGYRTYSLERSAAPASSSVKLDNVLESPYYRVELDGSGNIVRISDKQHGRLLMDAAHQGEAGAFKIKPASKLLETESPARLTRETGTVMDRITVERPGSLWPRTVITLPQAESRILILETLDRSRMPFVPYKSETLDVSFGFRFGLENGQLLVEDGNGVASFPQYTLPGTRKDAVVPRHAITWSNGDYHVTLMQKDSFYDTLRSEGSQIAGLDVGVMLKSDQSETKDLGVQSFDTFEPRFGPERTFSFAIQSSSGAADPIAIYRDSTSDDANEVVLLPSSIAPAKNSGSLLSVGDAGVVVLDLKPSEDGVASDYTLRLQEIAGKHSVAALTLPATIISVSETSLTEDRILGTDLSLSHIDIAPHQTLTLRLTVQPGAATARGDAR
jgi:alpha-mannosidase